MLVATCFVHVGVFAQDEIQDGKQPEKVSAKHYGESEDYRRSSLCLLLITNKGDKYAQAIEDQFKAMPLPARYNDLNVNVRVLNVNKKSTEKRVTKALKERGLAKELVGTWFNRDNSGRMNMERIHDWGGYNANYSDLKRAQSTERGLALLSDEGAELIKNTFVLVCDISYYDKSNTGKVLAGLFSAAAATMDVMAQQQANKGNTANAQMYSSMSTLGVAGSALSQEIAGFSVNIMAYLYRLKWTDKLRDKMYSQYWVDEELSPAEAQSRRRAFDNDNTSFQLEYLGKYRTRSGKTVSKSTSNLDLVIRQVCSDAVDKGINNLAKMYPVFKPKTAFTCDEGNIYAYIGTKEGVNIKSKYEVLETKKKKSGFEYKKVATVVPVVGKIWNNRNMLISSDSLEQKYKGTMFRRTGGRKDICGQGLTMREMGKLGYQYKKHRLYWGLVAGALTVSNDKVEKAFNERPRYNETYEYSDVSGGVFGFEMGWLVNFHTRFGWNVLSMQEVGGNGLLQLAFGSGAVFRTKPWGKNGRWSMFVWPTIGYGLTFADVTCHYVKRVSHYKYYTYDYKTEKISIDDFGFNWNVKVGMNITERFLVCANLSQYYKGATIGYLF